MFKHFLMAGILAALFASSANAQQWYAEESQGIRRAKIKYGTTVLIVNCVTTAANVSNSLSVNFYRAGPEGFLTFDFGGGVVLPVPFQGGSLTANTPANQQLFSQLVGLLKSASNVTISDPNVGARRTFSLRGSSRAIGPCAFRSAQTGPIPIQPAPQENVVLKIETYLARLGFTPGTVDGVIDDATYAAISAYQTARGLPLTGGMTMEEFRALEAEIYSLTSPASSNSREALTTQPSSSISNSASLVANNGIITVSRIRFEPSDNRAWCRRIGSFTYSGPREILQEGLLSDHYPKFAVFGQALRVACPEMELVEYTHATNDGISKSGRFGASNSDFVPMGLADARASSASVPMFECDRLSSHPRDIQAPAAALGIMEPQIDAVAARRACIVDLARNPSVPRLQFQLARALLLTGEHEAAAVALRAAHDANHALATLYLGMAYANGWGVPIDLREANILWRAADDRGAYSDGRSIELAVAAATNSSARVICNYGDTACERRKSRPVFKSNLTTADHARIEPLFQDVPSDLREVFISLFAADFSGLEKLKQGQVDRSSGQDTVLGLFADVFPELLNIVDESAANSRYQPVVAQYALIKTNALGLCGEPGSRFAVTETITTQWRDGYGFVTNSYTREGGTTYFTVPQKFSKIVQTADTTDTWASFSNGIQKMIERNGGCGSDVLAKLEENMLVYQGWSPN